MFEAMVRGWRAQQKARGLRSDTIEDRERLVLRFLEATNEYPWNWGPAHVEEWIVSMSGERHLALSTIRSYQGDVRLFTEFLVDCRYGWGPACEDAFGTYPVAICHEWNTIAHLNDYEGDPEARPFTREELQRFLDYADDQVERAVKSKRKGALAAYRDATLFKVIYGWGLRRREAAMLDVTDFAANPAAPELGGLGTCHVRYGKAMKSSPPRRRAVATVMPWAAEALTQYLEEVRPRYGQAGHPAVWLTERGGRISARQIDDRFAQLRGLAGLPDELSVHCLRHSYVSHLIEDGADPLFVQWQAGHSWASTTATYTTVGQDARNRMLRAALARAYQGEDGT